MTDATKRSGAPKHRRGWGASTITLTLEHEHGEAVVPFEVQACGTVYHRSKRDGTLRRVRDPRVIRAVLTKLEARRKKEAVGDA